ncbi:MAG: DUF983 domain-containing protein [Acidimicrobiia bacterium]
MERAGFGTMFGRGLRKRCPRCGGGGIFRSFGELHDRCPTCGLRFEREHGYWVGAMIINTVVTFGLLLLVLVGGMILWWPDVPWTPLFVATVVVAGLTPILFQPRSRTVWMAIEMSYHPVEGDG